MIERIKQILPNDRLKVFQHSTFFEDAEEVITLLYQPLIKITGVAVFQMFWKEVKLQQPQTSISHHQLMNMLNITLDEFYEARIRLEAIGLIKTYKEEGTYTTFYYLLKRPFSAKGFFEDPMLSVLLEHQIGKDAFNRLKRNFLKPNPVPANAQNITKSFNEVFTTVKPGQAVQEPIVHEEESIDVQSILPLEWLHKMLEQQKIDSKRILTRSNINFIEKLSKIYDVDLLELEKAVIWAINEEQIFDRKEFQDMCKDIYYRKHGSVPPRLYSKGDQEKYIKKDTSGEKKRSLSKEERLIEHFEKISHRELLEDFSTSGKASMKEINMLTDVMEEHGLTQPVMNVLVDYVLKRSGNKLNRNYIDTIAAHWSREGIATAKAAMQIAKREHHLYQNWQQKKTTKQEPARKEVLPKWYQEQKQQKSDKGIPQKETEDLDQIDQEVEEFFKRYTRKKS
ncbi:replication initiation and membrane attachment family protein [Bacillaceae bacterium W0354]